MATRAALARGLKGWSAALVSLILGTAAPASGVTCHCFRDRTYDPADPAAVEPYLRATAGNSLLSAVSGVPKGDLVRALMGGTPAPDLWVAHSLAAASGGDAAALLKARAAGRGWPEILARSRLPEERRQSLLAGGESAERIASGIVREVLLRDLKADPADLAGAEKNTGSYQETILAVLTSRWTGRPAASLAAEVKAGRASWGALLHGAGVAPDRIDERIRALLAPGGGRR